MGIQIVLVSSKMLVTSSVIQYMIQTPKIDGGCSISSSGDSQKGVLLNAVAPARNELYYYRSGHS